MRLRLFQVTAFLLAANAPSLMADYRQTVLDTANMTTNPEVRSIVGQHGLQVLSLTWEDTGRFKNSSVGPNISDMTIQVAVPQENGDGQSVHCMPVIRYPNFTDKTADLAPEDFTLLVGNEAGSELRSITLEEFLKNPTLYLHDPGSWRGDGRRSLYAPKRDSKVLVSAQACFLPIPQEGSATFNPVLFNYQSFAGDPAVLTLLVTRGGTSVTVIDNQRDAFSEGNAWGQRLFFNANGERASLTGERKSDFEERGEPESENATEQPTATAADEGDLNLVMLIQIPLKQRNPMPPVVGDAFGGELLAVAEAVPAAPMSSDVEDAVIGHGELEGPFTEIDDLPIERDERFPVRVTVQYYKATSNGVVSADDVADIAAQINRIYEAGDAVGSLVVHGETGRTTEYDGPKVMPEDWWNDFWTRHETNTGDTREEAIRKLRELLGEDFETCPVTEDYLNTLLESHELPEGFQGTAESGKSKPGFLKALFGG
ncbi:MAG: hypothetical protein AAF236_09615 [Verrucomicrobiota bacterium]